MTQERRDQLLGWLTTILVILFVVGVMFAIKVALGRDLSGRYAQASPEIRQWFNSLTNKQRGPCCAFADGYRVDNPDWEITGDPAKPYRVYVDGTWLDVPDYAVVDSSNKLGYPIVWPSKQDNVPFVRCFLSGTGA